MVGGRRGSERDGMMEGPGRGRGQRFPILFFDLALELEILGFPLFESLPRHCREWLCNVVTLTDV